MIPPRIDSTLDFNSRVNIIFQDSQHNHWFVSHDDGVCKYDGKQFSYFTEEQGLKQVRAIQEGSNGDIWFGIADGLSIFDGQSFTTITPEKESLLITDSFSSSETNFQEEWKKELNHFWFSAYSQNGVYRYDGKKLQHLKLPVPKDYPDFGKTGHNPEYGWDEYAVYSIYKDNNKNLWFGTPGAGLFRYDGKSIVCINENEEKGIVRAIHEDKNGILWFGNNAKGVYQYDGQSFINFSKKRGAFKKGFVSALTIEEDKQGRLWFGTFSSGLWRYNLPADPNKPSTNMKEDLLSNFTDKDGLDYYISTLYIDKQDKLWIGTGKGDVFVFNGKKFDKNTKD